MRSAKSFARLLAAMLIFCSIAYTQEMANSAATAEVPRLVNYSGSITNAGVGPAAVVGVTFAIYKDQSAGSPLWMETQNVQPDAKHNYTVQLGANSSQGLPLELFASGEARWLGVRVNGGEEQPRVLLLSVPYALKAADAQTLGGLPASAFVLAAPAVANSIAGTSVQTAGGVPSSSAPGSLSPVGGTGTANFIPLWTDSADLGNSILYQLGTGSTARIGINITNPLFTLDVKGSELVRGLFEMATTGYATASKGFISNPLNIESSAFSSSTAKYTVNHFQWQAEPVGNNTTSPGATLNLLYGTDPNPPTETGLSLSSKGIFRFAPGQTFPGAGSVTSVGLSAPSSDFTVSGSPVTSSGTLGLAWKVVPTNANTANAIVKRDANGAFSAGEINAASVGTVSAALTGTNSVSGYGVLGQATGGSGQGVWGEAFGTQFSANGQGADGVHGQSHTHNGSGVAGLNSDSTGIGVYGQGTGFYSTGSGYGVYGVGALGVYGGSKTGDGYGVEGINTAENGTGVYGYGAEGGYFLGLPLNQVTGPGALLAQGASNTDYYGEAGAAFYGGAGTSGFAGGDGLYAYAGNPGPSYAGFFFGDVSITGTLSKGGGSFKIDHPLDPANKYLSHSFVESPDMMNVYNGNVILDGKGTATIQLPDWFETLNRDFRYQLTSIGGFAPVYIAQKVEGNAFKIAGGTPGMEVSWQVTGIRQDPWANAHRIPIEQQKDARERGFYLHPELYGQPVEKGMQWARNPEGMKRMAQRVKQPAPAARPISVKRELSGGSAK
jgi:trimeric autotransporter adhesin